MLKKKTTGKILAFSAIAVCVCFAMLLGTTFAWFTDSAKTHVNYIKTGNFEIDIQDATGVSLAGDTLDFVRANGAVINNADLLWEPGMVIRTETFNIVNNGDYALKFKIETAFANGVTTDNATGNTSTVDLTDKITYTIYYADGSVYAEGSDVTLTTVDNSKSFYIEFEMLEGDDDNDYQNLTLEFTDAAISVSATQFTYETDSYDTDYDESAEYETEAATTTAP